MKYFLVDINPSLCEAWDEVFDGVPNVQIKNQSIFTLKADALVSPANSMGYMNGGLDFLISKNLGWHVEKRLQEKIRQKHFGELLVGQAEIVETDQENFPYLISAPTMRHPMSILHTPNIYQATKALLILIHHKSFEDGQTIKEKVQSVAIPGLGTGVGQVPAYECARQMRLAWEDILQEHFREEESWKKMNDNFLYFYTGNTKYLKYDIP